MAFTHLAAGRSSLPRRLTTTVVVALCLVLGPLAAAPAQAAGPYTVTGMVAGEGGGPLDDMPVELQRYDAVTQTYESIDFDDTDAQGGYTFAAVPGGTFRVHVVSDGKYVDGFSAPFTPPSGVAVPVVTVAVGGSVSGRVLETGTGAAIEDVTIEAFPSVSTGSSAPLITTTDETGRFRLGGMPSGNVTLRIRDEAGSHVSEYYDDARTAATATTVPVQQGTETALRAISLDVGATFTGTVTDADGVPVGGATVRAVSTGGTVEEARSDDSGQYAVHGLPAGDYTIQFVGAVGYFDRTERGTQTVTAGQNLPLGATVLEKTAEMFGTVTDTAGAPLGGIVVDAVPVVGSSLGATATTTGDGSFVLRQLHAGTYRLRVSDVRHAYVDRFFDDDITIEGGESVDATSVAMSPTPVVAPPSLPVVVKKTSSIAIKAKAAKKKVTLTITVKASGVTPTGKVTIKLGRKKLKTVTLKRGTTKVTLTKQKKGKRVYTVVYAGDSRVRERTVNSKKITIR
jgi:hypothetical protein